MLERVGSSRVPFAPLQPSGNGWSANVCLLSSRPTRGWMALALFTVPGTFLWCCHGEVILFLVTGYLGECQTASGSGPMSKGLSSGCLPTAVPTLSSHCLAPSVRSNTFRRGSIHPYTQRHYRRLLRERGCDHGSFLLHTLKSMAGRGVPPTPLSVQ